MGIWDKEGVLLPLLYPSCTLLPPSFLSFFSFFFLFFLFGGVMVSSHLHFERLPRSTAVSAYQGFSTGLATQPSSYMQVQLLGGIDVNF